MTARLPWQPPERRREDKAAGRREWAASRAWRQRVCSGAPAPAPPRPGPRAAAAHPSPVREHPGGHGRNGHSCADKTGGRKASARNCARCAGGPRPPAPTPGASRGDRTGGPEAPRARPGAASDYGGGLHTPGAAGRAGMETEGLTPEPAWGNFQGGHVAFSGGRPGERAEGTGDPHPHRKPFTPSRHPRIAHIQGPLCSWDRLNFRGLTCKPAETPIDRCFSAV